MWAPGVAVTAGEPRVFKGHTKPVASTRFSADGKRIVTTSQFDSTARVWDTETSLELANLELRQRHYSRSVEHLKHALTIEHNDTVADYLARVQTLVGEEASTSP